MEVREVMITRKPDGSPWRVGVLWSQTGVTAVIEESQLKGTLLAVDEINNLGGINGRELVPIIYDPASDPKRFAMHAEQLLCQDEVTTIFGCYTSSSRKAVMPIVEQRNGLLWYPTLYEGFEYSPNIIYTGAAPNQNSLRLVEYLLEHYGNRFFLVGSDYIYPWESNRIIRELLTIRTGEVIAERYVDLRANPHDFLPVIREIRQLSPDVIFSTVVGDGTKHLYQAYTDAGFSPKAMPIASLTTSEAEILAMGSDVAEGHITAASYFQCLDTEENCEFVAKYKKRYGDSERTNLCAEAAYSQVHIFARALAETNTMDTDILRPMILGSEFNAPQGQISINRYNNHTDVWSRVGRADHRGQFEIVRESRIAVKPDPFMISL